jgi:hypothetical protein
MYRKKLGLQFAGMVAALVLAYLFSASSLARYDLQVMAVLFIVYFLAKKLFSGKAGESLLVFFEAWLFVFVVTATVFSTGGAQSPFFFLFYFLLFALALILNPLVSLVLTISLVLMFFSLNNFNTNFKELLPVLSLPFIAPFAKYLGDLQQRYLRQKNELKRLEKAKSKSDSLELYEKEQTLIFLNTVIFSHLEELNERLENFMGDSDLDYLKNKLTELKKAFSNFKKYLEKLT